MTPETTNTELVHQTFEAFNRNDIDGLMALYQDDVVLERIPGEVFRGKRAVRGFWMESFDAFPEMELEVVSILDADDRVAVEWRCHGTFTGAPYQGFHATGKSVNFRGCSFIRNRDGLVAEVMIYMDAMTWSRQIGALPAEGALGDKAMVTAFNAQTDLVTAIREWRQKRQHSQ